MGKGEIAQVTSNFSFSHSVFSRLVLQIRKNKGLYGKGLTNSPVLEKSPFYSYRNDICRKFEVMLFEKELRDCPQNGSSEGIVFPDMSSYINHCLTSEDRITL